MSTHRAGFLRLACINISLFLHAFGLTLLIKRVLKILSFRLRFFDRATPPKQIRSHNDLAMASQLVENQSPLPSFQLIASYGISLGMG